MKRVLLLSLMIFSLHVLYGQKKNVTKKHYVCFQSANTYHDRANCAALQMCAGRTRAIKDVSGMQACPKCATPIFRSAGFHDIKRVLGVKDKKQIKDSLGTAEGTIHRPGG